MKQSYKYLVLAAFLGLFMLPAKSDAGISVYLRIGPPRAKTVVFRPANPYRRAIWVKGHWRHSKGRFVWVRGYWIRPRAGFVYIQPHWKKSRRGYFFVAGHWKRI